MFTRLYCITVLFLILPLTYQKRNTTYVVDIKDENHKVTKYTAVLLFVIFLLYGIVSNILLAIVFCRRRDNHYSREFIVIGSQLIISSFMAFIPQMVVVLPEILRTKNSSFADQMIWINRIFATFATIPFFAILYFSFLLTLNRFVALILPKCYIVFEAARLYFLIAFVWLSVLANTAVDIYYCTRRFNVLKVSWEADCTKSGAAGDIWWRMRYFLAILIPNVKFVIYIMIFYSIRHKRLFATDNNQRKTNICAGNEMNEMKIHHYEWLMLIQAAWECAIMEIGIIAFNFLPKCLSRIFDERAIIPSKIFINCYFIFICASLPTVHFIYNKRAREIIKHYLYRWLNLKIGQLKNKVGVRKHSTLW
ncbi:hypothetical protein LOAG_08513 [Loa loa]|uniref:G-protein coupled receptors family 1 profile domain-containing protein n=1 Tax=Loa loa TaxID=7209 RepID=A0A1S0TV42_LOALO|nr:hypothetical protein LOAG_08513 [Loa loa]EFO19979.1 hypothetical protein LOAG_08513 [Loa loa]